MKYERREGRQLSDAVTIAMAAHIRHELVSACASPIGIFPNKAVPSFSTQTAYAVINLHVIVRNKEIHEMSSSVHSQPPLARSHTVGTSQLVNAPMFVQNFIQVLHILQPLLLRARFIAVTRFLVNAKHRVQSCGLLSCQMISPCQLRNVSSHCLQWSYML